MGRSFVALKDSLVDGLRCLFFRRPRDGSFALSFRALLVLAGLSLASSAVTSYVYGAGQARFTVDGLVSQIAGLVVFAVLIAVASLPSRMARPVRLVAGLIATALCLNLIVATIVVGWQLAPPSLADSPAAIWLPFIGSVGLLVWLFASTYLMAHRLAERQRFLSGLGAVLASALSMFALPNQQIFETSDGSSLEFNLVEYVVDTLRPAPAPNYGPWPPRIDTEQVYYNQRSLLAVALDGMQPGRADPLRVFFLGMAAYGEQEVFRREVTSAQGIVDERLGSRGRSMLLVNHRSTVDTLPVANVRNLELALAGLAKRMDVDNDLLMLLITSHGSEGMLAVRFNGFDFDPLTPTRLRAALDASGIKNRLIVISACHAGSFIPALEDEHTAILTAARADRTSFGCSNERDWTYFGDAFFNHALRETPSIEAAFDKAKSLIGTWEARDGLTPSEPQLSMGAEIKPKLDALARARVERQRADLK